LGIDYGWCMNAAPRSWLPGIVVICSGALTSFGNAGTSRFKPRATGTSRHFPTFQHFTGVLPLQPWKPNERQAAQQAMFLCTANVEVTFVENFDALLTVWPDAPVLHKLVIPSHLRETALEQLWMMNVTAASLFPDLGGLARAARR
jgi:hypothetical protein